MEDLIAKYLQNTITAPEANELRLWLAKDARNRRVFENIVGEWSLDQSEVDHLKRSVYQRITHEEKAIRKHSSISYLSKVAAAIAFLLTVTGIIIFQADLTGSSQSADQQGFVEKATLRGQKLTFTLPDGTIVKLNSGSRLVYPPDFSNDLRQVVLTGEAFFEVVRDESRPFVIQSGGISTQVLGTSFDVRAYPEEEIYAVGVLTGTVKVITDEGGDEVILSSKEKVEFSASTNQMKTFQIPDEALMFGWTNKTLIFKDEGLSQILMELERWYNIEIMIDEQYLIDQKKEFTAKYQDPNLKEVMESLAYSYDFNYEHDPEIRTIKITR